jgi:hypothetical protein
MAEVKKPISESKKPENTEFAFGKQNYRMMFIGLGFIFLGFILMIGGGSDDPKVFSYALFDFQRLTLAPLLLLTGYVIEIFAIMKKHKKVNE